MDRDYHKESIGIAMRLFTVAFAAGAALMAWTVQNRTAEAELFVRGGWVGVALSVVGSAFALGWALVALRRLRGEDHDDQ